MSCEEPEAVDGELVNTYSVHSEHYWANPWRILRPWEWDIVGRVEIAQNVIQHIF